MLSNLGAVTEQGALRAMRVLAEEGLRKKYDPEAEMAIEVCQERGGKQIKAIVSFQRSFILFSYLG